MILQSDEFLLIAHPDDATTFTIATPAPPSDEALRVRAEQVRELVNS